MAKHPPVGNAKWHSVFADDECKVWQDGNDDIFFKGCDQGPTCKIFLQ